MTRFDRDGDGNFGTWKGVGNKTDEKRKEDGGSMASTELRGA